MHVIVAQKGAREHFLAARALNQEGMLAALVTDWYATPMFRRIGGLMDWWIGGRGRSALAAQAEGIPDPLVQAMPLRSLWWKWRVRMAVRRGFLYDGYVQMDAAFARAIARMKLPEHEVFFGYSYASLEMLETEKKRGVFTVLDQIDPGVVEFRLVAEEMTRHPEIAGPPPEFPTAYYERNRREWDLADIIVVNSEWSREAIIVEGADPAKIEVLPLAFEVNAECGMRNAECKDSKLSTFNSQPSTAPLRVLWLGQVNVRKGIHYLMAAAKLLEGENIHFDVVGPIGILPGAVASAPRNMTFHGPVSRDCAAEWYRQADVFVLPTLSDGFALTQLEALAHGLPLIVTPNCGRVVEEGKTGFIIPSRDPQALAEAILRFMRNRDLIHQMHPYCHEAVEAYSIKSYGERLKQLVEKHGSKSIS
jgi:hypothetical protein